MAHGPPCGHALSLSLRIWLCFMTSLVLIYGVNREYRVNHALTQEATRVMRSAPGHIETTYFDNTYRYCTYMLFF